ncbi:class II glutamine amidotransferase [Halorarum halobium]|uniref:class II glutamine amidotransferase n=1 Tax=Halorarum halobium TaxID=3075121 RepID=UPI0028A8B108|nr:class II glutamine amidotransferase [Halobaculum sp. XH14]
MCEIFFLHNPTGTIKTSNLIRLLHVAVHEAAPRNSDGFGVFNEDREVYKSEEQLGFEDIEEIVERYKDSRFIVLHLRLATQGAVCFKNSHPFKHRENVLVHNGSVTPENHFKDGRADSYQLLRDIYKRKDRDTVNAVQNSLKNTSGSVSVFLYDYKGDLYYFRDGSRFQFARIKDTGELAGATVGHRLDSAFGWENLRYSEPEEETVYQIDQKIKKADQFHMEPQIVTDRSDSVYSSFGWGSYEEDVEYEDEDEELIQESDWDEYQRKLEMYRQPHR